MRIRNGNLNPYLPVVSVLTATIPGREKFLEECELTVQYQTFGGWEHIVALDENHEGCSVTVNRMADQARGQWFLLIADDDLLLPRAIETYLDAGTEDVDIVYGPPLVWGIHDPWWYFQAPPAIPATALIRESVWRELGGYDPEAKREEDRGLWIRAMKAGKVFRRVSYPTWVYRMHSDNKSLAENRSLVVAA